MAIGKITRGNGFYGLMKYLLDEQKSPKILGGCIVGSKPDDIAREFRQIANLRPGVQKPVRHFSISFAPEDGNVDDLVKETIAYRVLDGLGYENCQFMAIGHRRDQAGHDEVHDHDHMHIVANSVTLDGEHVDGSFDRFKIQKVLREVEEEFGLKQIKSSWEVKNEKGLSIDRESEIARLVATSLENKPSLAVWLDRLAIDQIDVRFNLTDRGVVQGVSFIKDGEAYKGSSIGAKWSRYKGKKNPSNLDEHCLIIGEIVQIGSQDIPLLKAANLKSQQHSVRLNEIDRAMFDRSAEMAEMAVMNQGRNGKFRNGRVEIALKDDRLKVRRVRPEKVMLEAVKVDGKWQAVGFPNIDKVDVQLLERINGTDGMNFRALERKASPTKQEPSQERVEVQEPEDFTGVDDLEIDSPTERLYQRIETTPKQLVQAAIDWAAEQATDTVVEYVKYLAQQGVSVEFESIEGAISLTYCREEANFKDTELIDASLLLLESARGLNFERDRLMANIESTPTNLHRTQLNRGTQIETTRVMDDEDEFEEDEFEEDYSL